MKFSTSIYLNHDEANKFNDLWWSCFGEVSTVESMVKIERSYSAENASMNITTYRGNIGISLDIESGDFMNIVSAIQCIGDSMVNDAIDSDSIRKAIKTFTDIFAESHINVSINEENMRYAHEYAKGTDEEMDANIRNFFIRMMEEEGYGPMYINENIDDYMTMHIHGSDAWIKIKNYKSSIR